MKSGVYLIHCLLSGKSYIGCSKYAKQRVVTHFGDLRAGRHINLKLQRAWNKYGESSFRSAILAYTEETFELEIKLISEYGTFKNGYNLTPGGEGVGADSVEVCEKRVRTFKRNYNEETKAKKSAKAKAQLLAMSDEERKRFATIGSNAAKEAIANLSEEEKAMRSSSLSEYSKRRWDKIPKEERSRQNRDIHMHRTEEERRASALKSWETRRKNKNG